jgi:hypothetical protein
MGDDTIDTVILDIDLGYLVTQGSTCNRPTVRNALASMLSFTDL